MQPRFSVVIPIHNKRRHVGRAISSVLAQSLRDFELIIVDDASTDGSAEEIERFGDYRIRRFTRSVPGAGGYAARNLAIGEARAERVAFIDADDEWQAEHLAELDRLFAEAPTATIAGSGFEDRGFETVTDRYTRDVGARGAHHVTIVDYMRAYARGRGAFRTSAVAAPRSDLLEVGGFPEGRCLRGGDIDTWVRLLCRGRGVRGTAVTAVHHRDSDNMVTKTTSGTEAPSCVEYTLQRLRRERRGVVFRLYLTRFEQYLRRSRLARTLRHRPAKPADLRGIAPVFAPAFYLALLAVVAFPGRFFPVLKTGGGPLAAALRRLLRVRFR